MPMIPCQYVRARTPGFTLLEVMICLVILAGGMLGMTAMQIEGLKYNKAAFTESQAQFLLNDMVERIRANRGNDAYVIGYAEAPPTQSVDCGAANAACTSNQMVIWDLNQWRSKVEDSTYMPQGQSEIVYDNLTHTFTISIRYDWSQLGGLDITNGQRTVTITTRI